MKHRTYPVYISTEERMDLKCTGRPDKTNSPSPLTAPAPSLGLLVRMSRHHILTHEVLVCILEDVYLSLFTRDISILGAGAVGG